MGNAFQFYDILRLYTEDAGPYLSLQIKEIVKFTILRAFLNPIFPIQKHG